MREVLISLYGDKGLGYSLGIGRLPTPIGSSIVAFYVLAKLKRSERLKAALPSRFLSHIS